MESGASSRSRRTDRPTMREGRGGRDDRFLDWKIGIFSIAAAVGLSGIFLEKRWMTGLALPLLMSAMLLRFLPVRATDPAVDDGHDEADMKDDSLSSD